MNKKPGILFDNRYFDHCISHPSPENPQRLRSLYLTLGNGSYRDKLRQFAPRQATSEEIQSVHSEFYLEQIREHARCGDPFSYDRDTYLMGSTLYTAQLAAGGCLELADRIMDKTIDYGFALIRPPGHHAEAGRGMGFCVLNNIGITAQYLRRVYGLDRILVVDYDVHHCNGTQSLFYETDHVLVLSLHQEKLFPFTGKATETGSGRGQGYTINVEVHPQFGNQEYTYIMGKLLGAVVEQYLPQIILISSGYDAHKDDHMSKILLTTSWFGTVTEILKYYARAFCNNRLLFVLEGGYNPEALEASVLATLDALMHPVGPPIGIVYSQRAHNVLVEHPCRAYWTF